MTTDIKELAQTLKAAAVRAKTATEEYESGRMSAGVCASECAEFNRLTDGPDQILPLIAALEAKEEQRANWFNVAQQQGNDLVAAEARIADLQSRAEAAESRSVTVRIPEFRMSAAEGKSKNLTWRQLGAYNEGADVAVEKNQQNSLCRWHTAPGGSMNYSKMTDGEISVLLGKLLRPKFDVTAHPNNPKGAILSDRVHTKWSYGYFPLSRSEDFFSEMLKYRIGITPAGKTVWKATHDSGLQVNHRNPLRAAAIVFLMLKAAEEICSDE